MINYKILLKAISFMFLPTFSVCFLIFMYFLNWNNFYTFISSQDVYSGIIRLCLLVLECIVVYNLYNYYLNKEKENFDIIKINDNVELITIQTKKTDSYMYVNDLIGELKTYIPYEITEYSIKKN